MFSEGLILFLWISAARKPSVAAIDGLALGGGLELSMVEFLCLKLPSIF